MGKLQSSREGNYAIQRILKWDGSGKGSNRAARDKRKKIVLLLYKASWKHGRTWMGLSSCGLAPWRSQGGPILNRKRASGTQADPFRARLSPAVWHSGALHPSQPLLPCCGITLPCSPFCLAAEQAVLNAPSQLLCEALFRRSGKVMVTNSIRCCRPAGLHPSCSGPEVCAAWNCSGGRG